MAYTNFIQSIMAAVDSFRNSSEDYAASFFAPIRQASTISGKMPRFGRDNQAKQNFAVPATADSPRVGRNMTTTSFACETHRGSDVLATEEQILDDTKLLNATEIALQVDEALAIEREGLVATVVNNYSGFTLNGTPTTKFNVPGGDIGEYIANLKLAVRQKINRWPTHMAVSGRMGPWLQQYVAKLGYGGGNTALASEVDIAKFFGLKGFKVCAAQYNSAKPGKTAVGADLYNDNMLWLFYPGSGSTTETPTFMATVEYKPLSQPRVEPLAAPHVKGLFIESAFCYDLVTVDETACYAVHTCLDTSV